MTKKRSEADEREINFVLEDELWGLYNEWCEGGYLVYDENDFPIAVKNTPSLKDFMVWKQTMGYFTEVSE